MRISIIAAIFVSALALSSCRTNETCSVSTAPKPAVAKKKTYQKSSSYKKSSVAKASKPAPKKKVETVAPSPAAASAFDFAAACTT